MRRYQDYLFRPMFRKGTSKKKRKLVTRFMQAIEEQYGDKILDTAEQVMLSQMLYGRAMTHIWWDDKAEEIQMRVLKGGEELK